MRNTFHDLETFSPTPIKDGTHKYAEKAEVMLWSWADEDGPVYVWDLVNGRVHWRDDLSGEWVSESQLGKHPPLLKIIDDPAALVWFQNGGMFDFVVLEQALPGTLHRIDRSRWRDTMVQAYAHALPGALDKLGEVLNISEDKRKLKRGRALVQLFCKPQADGSRNTKQTHPVEWQEFIEYAGGDITTMRAVHRLMPMWNYKGKQVELWHLDLTINSRGFAVDIPLAQAAVRTAERVQAGLADETQALTDDQVRSANQRDAMLAYILAEHGVDLPNMQADTLERRLADPDLPQGVRDLIAVRLQASMNSVSKFKTLLKGVNSDGRLRGCMQYRGAGRTGRWAHRMFQPGNLPRSTLPQATIDLAIDAMKNDCLELVLDKPMQAMSNTIRGAIIAPPGRKLVIADLSNIEGRVAAWLAGEEWKLDAFRAFDAGEGSDLYILAYAKSFNVPPADVPKKGPQRQIGKVEELMFQYGGGVGAWITGAATYGIDLDKMTEQVLPVLPEWAVLEAQQFLDWLYEGPKAKFEKAMDALKRKATEPDAPDFVPMPTKEQWAIWMHDEESLLVANLTAACAKVRHGLPEQTFIACDAIKRTWRRAHPMISSYWKDLEDTVRQAIASPGVTFPCRKVKIRRDGAWLRIGLPSGRALCYPNPQVDEGGKISYTGFDNYKKAWGKVGTYGGKLLENITQAVAADQLAEPMPAVEAEGYAIVLHVHDELVCETPDTDAFTADRLAELMCSDLGWNAGLPLAAAGFETYRYRKD